MIARIESVTVRYGRIRALDDVSVAFPEGAVGLLGPNGAGKSSLIKALLGLVAPRRGRVEVLGLDARRAARRIRAKIGYMPEDDCFLPGMSGIESIAYLAELSGLPRRAARSRAHELADFVGLGEERYRAAQTYSTGMRQKAKFAQALAHGPALVFLDEPTNGLDPDGRRRLLRLVRHLSRDRGVGVLLSTHLLPDVEATCDAVVILGKGKVLRQGTLAELQKPQSPHYTVSADVNGDRFTAACASRGAIAEQTGPGRYRIGGAGMDDLAGRIFAAARESGATLRRMEPARTSLEAVFLEATSEKKGEHGDR